MKKSLVFSEGPAITVTLTFQAQQLTSAALSFSEKFQCCLVGDVNNHLKDQLFNFLEQYGKKLPGEVQLTLDGLTPFRQKALKRLQHVPFGEVVTYGELATIIDHPGAARAVGTACSCNPFLLFIPCHRVVASAGKMGGFASGLDMKKYLLEFEDGNLH